MPLSIAKIANCVWSSEKPRAISEKQTHPRRVTVWCGFWPGGVIGPYFFEKEAGRAATVNGARYHGSFRRNSMISMRPIRGFDETMPRAMQPMKRFDYRTRHFLLVYSLVSVIRIGSCDLMPLDFFLWGYSKWKVYVDNPTTTIMQKGGEKFRRKGLWFV